MKKRTAEVLRKILGDKEFNRFLLCVEEKRKKRKEDENRQSY